MIKRWIVGLTAFLLTGIFLLPQLAADMNFFFSRQFDKIIWNPFVGWVDMIASSKALQFYFLLLAAVGLLLLWILFTGSYLNYRSDMQRITPDIFTPCAAGQGQFGTARWLPKRDIPRFFGVWKLSPKGDAFSDLLKAGIADKEEIKRAEIHIE